MTTLLIFPVSVTFSDLIPFLAAFSLFAVIHSLMAADGFKRAVFGVMPGLRFYYRAIYNLISVAMLAWMWFLVPVPNPELYRISGVWMVVMILIQVTGVAGLLHTVRLFGSGVFTGVSQLRDAFGNEEPEYTLDEPRQDSFIISGPYRFVRHPLYFFSILFLAFIPVMSLKWALLSICSIVYFIVGSRLEEQKLVRRFGDTY